MNESAKTLKKVMHQGMLDNFTKDGSLTPVLFWLENGKPQISQIPFTYLSNPNGKAILGAIIEGKCALEEVTVMGMVFEAYGFTANLDDDDDNAVVDKIRKGEMKVSDSDKKRDIIVLIFSTPDEHEVISYNVDVENKKVLDKYMDNSGVSGEGIFNSFFNWKKNKKHLHN